MQKKPPKDLQEFCKNWVMMLNSANSRFPIFMDQWNFHFLWKLWNLPRLTQKQAMNPNFTLESYTKSHNLRHSVEILWVYDLLNELGSRYPLRGYVFELVSTFVLLDVLHETPKLWTPLNRNTTILFTSNMIFQQCNATISDRQQST